MDRSVNVDVMGGGVTSGPVAQRLLESGMNIGALRTNDVLYNRDWILVDKAILQVSRQRLVAVKDLFDNGLTFPVADALGVMRVEWEKVSDFGTADVNMSGVAQGDSDRVNFSLDSTPLPIVHKDFNINIRSLTASRRMGHPLDVTQVALATRIVTEKVESILFNGGLNLGTNGQVYGYKTAPSKHTGNLVAGWDAAATTGTSILGDLLTILEALYAGNMYGPYGVYVSNNSYINLGADFKANGPLTTLQRLLQVPGIKFIKPTSNLVDTSGQPQVIVVQLTPDVVDMIDGIQPMAVQWESQGGMVMNFKVMSILVPRMKTTYTNQSGIAVYNHP